MTRGDILNKIALMNGVTELSVNSGAGFEPGGHVYITVSRDLITTEDSGQLFKLLENTDFNHILTMVP